MNDEKAKILIHYIRFHFLKHVSAVSFSPLEIHLLLSHCCLNNINVIATWSRTLAHKVYLCTLTAESEIPCCCCCSLSNGILTSMLWWLGGSIEELESLREVTFDRHLEVSVSKTCMNISMEILYMTAHDPTDWAKIYSIHLIWINIWDVLTPDI